MRQMMVQKRCLRHLYLVSGNDLSGWIKRSQGLLHKVIEAEREAGLKDGSLPKIHIAGCMSSCGTHQIGEIGFPEV